MTPNPYSSTQTPERLRRESYVFIHAEKASHPTLEYKEPPLPTWQSLTMNKKRRPHCDRRCIKDDNFQLVRRLNRNRPRPRKAERCSRIDSVSHHLTIGSKPSCDGSYLCNRWLRVHSDARYYLSRSASRRCLVASRPRDQASAPKTP
jgi:hypothetical protein